MICTTTLVLVAQVVEQSGLRHYYWPLRQKAVATGCATAFCRVARPVAQWQRKHPDGPSSPDCSRGGTESVWPLARAIPARLFTRRFYFGLH
jgi:hypothetical protein